MSPGKGKAKRTLSMYHILIADDELAMLKGILFHLQDNPQFEVVSASGRDEAINIIASQELDLLVCDLMMPEIEDGLAVMRAAKEQWYMPTVLAMTAFDTVENAVLAMQAGADDFIPKGFGTEELSLRIDNMLEKKKQIDQLLNENRILRETIRQQYHDFRIIGNSPQIRELQSRLQKIAGDATATCLIEGENGTGKELFARAIHAASRRKDAPFISINCAAIPEQDMEGELFGYEKGAFSTAYTAKPGLFENARNGVIFLDDIDEMPDAMQVRLLPVLEERRFQRNGGKKVIELEAMIIAATKKNLQTLVQNGQFRQDLFFLLNVVSLTITPLLERREDIRLLAQFFLDQLNKERKKQLFFAEESLRILESYDFPGNVRELKNIIEDAFVFCESNTIQPHNLSIKSTDEGIYGRGKTLSAPADYFALGYKDALQSFERDYFDRLLEDHNGDLIEAAQRAGVNPEWFSQKIKELGLK